MVMPVAEGVELNSNILQAVRSFPGTCCPRPQKALGSERRIPRYDQRSRGIRLCLSPPLAEAARLTRPKVSTGRPTGNGVREPTHTTLGISLD